MKIQKTPPEALPERSLKWLRRLQRAQGHARGESALECLALDWGCELGRECVGVPRQRMPAGAGAGAGLVAIGNYKVGALEYKTEAAPFGCLLCLS